MSARLNDLMGMLIYSDEYTDMMQAMSEASTMERARAVAEITRLNPAILQDNEALQGLCNDLSISQIMISNDEGEINIALQAELGSLETTPFDNVNSLRQCIHNPGHEVKMSGDKTATGTPMQYAAVHRQDEPGVIIIGTRGPSSGVAQAISSFADLAKNYDLGKNSYIVAFKDGALLGDDITPFPSTDLISVPINKAHKMRLGDAEYFSYAIRQNGYQLVGVMPVQELSRATLHTLHPVLVSNAVLFMVVFALVVYLLQRLVISNIARINTSLRKIVQGDLSERIDSHGFPAELRKLSHNINEAVDALQTYAAKNDETAAHEQELAHGIQNAIMPHIFPAFPQRSEFDIYAICRQANGIGGAFYDYFTLGDDTLCFALGVASGSGTSGALFATHALSLIRRYAHADMPIGEIMSQTNTALCDEEFHGLHMALIYGMLQISTGELNYVSAGSISMLMQRKGGSYICPETRPALALGQSAGSTYAPCFCSMESGDRIFLYTEGVTEATDHEHTPFGEANLLEILNGAAPSIADVPRRVNQTHRKFTRGAEMSEDIAMLALEFIGKRHEQAHLTLQAGAPAVAEDFLAEHLEGVFASPPAIIALQQAVQRISATLPTEAQIDLQLDYDEELARVELHYPSPAYNPLPQLTELDVNRAVHDQLDDESNLITLWKNLS